MHQRQITGEITGETTGKITGEITGKITEGLLEQKFPQVKPHSDKPIDAHKSNELQRTNQESINFHGIIGRVEVQIFQELKYEQKPSSIMILGVVVGLNYVLTKKTQQLSQYFSQQKKKNCRINSIKFAYQFEKQQKKVKKISISQFYECKSHNILILKVSENDKFKEQNICQLNINYSDQTKNKKFLMISKNKEDKIIIENQQLNYLNCEDVEKQHIQQESQLFIKDAQNSHFLQTLIKNNQKFYQQLKQDMQENSLDQDRNKDKYQKYTKNAASSKINRELKEHKRAILKQILKKEQTLGELLKKINKAYNKLQELQSNQALTPQEKIQILNLQKMIQEQSVEYSEKQQQLESYLCRNQIKYEDIIKNVGAKHQDLQNKS